ncbi:DUF1206 domain-containing protein [Rhodobacterales bacterium HKCCE2091]|nr:DUF1206 domain-containing protein [Rhodobacterales bacterium HKCCE2091]
MAENGYGWAIPVMRAGYSGRGITYLAVAGLSLWAILRGGEAQGTGDTLRDLAQAGWGVVVLVLIFLGLLAYAIWRVIDAWADLECYGSELKGIVARIGMVVTGLIHGVIGGLALVILVGGRSEGGGNGLAGLAETVLSMPGGRWIVGLAGVATLGAGAYYLKKAWNSEYRRHLRGNTFTTRFDWLLKAGVAAQAAVILIVGGFLVTAGLTADGGRVGGLERAFEWLRTQPFGNMLVVLLCIGLLAFAVFCFVNAAYRIVPRADGDDIETLASRVKMRLREATA